MNNAFSAESQPLGKIGGKAFYLQQMMKGGFPVPPFLVIPKDVINNLTASIRSDLDAAFRQLLSVDFAHLGPIAFAIQNKITTLPFPDDFTNAVVKASNQLFGSDFKVAVRSSAIGEDSAGASFAGQHASYLFVDAKHLCDKIKAVIASAWSAGALQYRRHQGLTMQSPEMAVIVQQMVEAEVSGVAFSMHLEGNLEDVVMVAGYGLGEGIVGDKVETDTFIYNPTTMAIQKSCATKNAAAVYNAERGITLTAIEAEKQHPPCLADEAIQQVSEYALAAQKSLKAPADVEFSFDRHGRLFILQMRPITTIRSEEIKILDNTNIVESYPGLTLPLTFSFVADAYRKVFTGSAKAFLLSGQTIARHASTFEHLLAHHCGRIYYRLDNWYRMVSLVYNSYQSMHAWEKAVGLESSGSEVVFFSFRKKIRTGLSFAWLLLTYPAGNRRFYRLFRANYSLLQQFKSLAHDPRALWLHYENATERLFKPWLHTIVNDFIAFNAFGKLQAFIERHHIGEGASVANDLLSGIGGVESEEAMQEVLRLKAMILGEPTLTALFSLPAGEVWAQLHQGHHPHFLQALEAYLERYGDRTLAELKLETLSMRQAPERFIKLLQNYLTSPITAEDFQKRQAALSQNALDLVNARFHWWQPVRWSFAVLRRLAAYGLKNRENMRFCRTRAYGVVKDIFSEVGKSMTGEGVIAHWQDVFYLELADLKKFCLAGEIADKKPQVAALKRQYEKYEALQLPDRIMYLGDTPPIIDRTAPTRKNMAYSHTGIGVSKGVVTAEAFVMTEPQLDAPVKGKILVTKMTDPGWIFLMTQAAGLISEKGSLLSHSAIIGREMGIPVVVGIADATSFIKSGDRLCLDGNAGTVMLQPTK